MVMKPASLACVLLFVAAPFFGQSEPAHNVSAARSNGSAIPRSTAGPAPPQASGLSFAPAVAHGSGGKLPLAVAVADLNGDGLADIVVANVCSIAGCVNGSTVGVILRNGGAFQKTVAYS